MKTNGSVYVAIVLTALVAYFGYQAWFNPQRTIKRQLGELAAALSVPPASNSASNQQTRVRLVGNYFAPDARVHVGLPGPEFASRNELLAALAAWMPPPEGINVDFVDVQIALDSNTDARAYVTVETTGRNARTGELARDSREVRVGLQKRDGAWVVIEVSNAQ
jgi:hypothetical protein